jgi:phosphosulfolactate synthase
MRDPLRPRTIAVYVATGFATELGSTRQVSEDGRSEMAQKPRHSGSYDGDRSNECDQLDFLEVPIASIGVTQWYERASLMFPCAGQQKKFKLFLARPPCSLTGRPGVRIMSSARNASTHAFVSMIGVADIEPSTSAFDPGYDPITLEGHLQQSHHLISILKLSMACWMIADERATRRKIAAAHAHKVPTVTGGGPFEIAAVQGKLPAYLDLCAEIGVTRIEAGEGFTDACFEASKVVEMARQRGLQVQFELGKKHDGAFRTDLVDRLIEQGRKWLDVGAEEIIVEARESAKGVGLFDDDGNLNRSFADRFARAFGIDRVTFEAPNKPSQFALIDHFGRAVRLSNVRLEELLRVEIYRRGLHSDAFQNARLRPKLLPREAA